MSVESHGGMILTGENRKTREKTLSQCHFVFVVIIIVRQLVIPYPLVIIIIIIIINTGSDVATAAFKFYGFAGLDRNVRELGDSANGFPTEQWKGRGTAVTLRHAFPALNTVG